MNKKRLPKAIIRTADDMRTAAAVADVIDWQEPSVRRTLGTEPAEGKGPGLAAGDNVIEMVPQPEASLASAESAPGALAAKSREIDMARRQSLARAIVERHANYSAMGGIIPLPIINVASITAIIMRMVKRLSVLYGMPYERDRARVAVIGLLGGAMPTGLSTVTASTLMYVVPGSNLLGLAVCSITASACTRRIGRIFVERFESGESLGDFPAISGR